MATLFGIITLAVLILVLAYLNLGAHQEHPGGAPVLERSAALANFALSFVLMILFFASWGGQAFAEWRTYVQEQEAHQQPPLAGEFFIESGQSTLENWQSEFLQLFSFVVLGRRLHPSRERGVER